MHITEQTKIWNYVMLKWSQKGLLNKRVSRAKFMLELRSKSNEFWIYIFEIGSNIFYIIWAQIYLNCLILTILNPARSWVRSQLD